jgi:ribonuclease P protein component
MMNFAYSKKERLRSKILIDKIFENGQKLYNSNLKIIWLAHILPEQVPVQSLVSVSKRRFKRANKRNLLKRRLREAFRKNKNDFYKSIENEGIQIALVIIYNSDSLSDFKAIEKNLLTAFGNIKSKISSGKFAM